MSCTEFRSGRSRGQLHLRHGFPRRAAAARPVGLATDGRERGVDELARRTGDDRMSPGGRWSPRPPSASTEGEGRVGRPRELSRHDEDGMPKISRRPVPFDVPFERESLWRRADGPAGRARHTAEPSVASTHQCASSRRLVARGVGAGGGGVDCLAVPGQCWVSGQPPHHSNSSFCPVPPEGSSHPHASEMKRWRYRNKASLSSLTTVVTATGRSLIIM